MHRSNVWTSNSSSQSVIPANLLIQVRSGMGAYAGAARRRVHRATVLLRSPSLHRPGRRQARHVRILQMGLHPTQPRFLLYSTHCWIIKLTSSSDPISGGILAGWISCVIFPTCWRRCVTWPGVSDIMICVLTFYLLFVIYENFLFTNPEPYFSLSLNIVMFANKLAVFYQL